MISDDEKLYIVSVPKVVCTVQPFGTEDITVHLTAWPSLWKRLWFFVFFGWRFKEKVEA